MIGGNHDFFVEEHAELFRELLPESITYLEDAGIIIDGIHLWGSPVLPDLINWAFGKTRGAAMKAHWDLIPDNIDILITHTPPKGILDLTSAGKSIGCEDLRASVDKLQPRVHIFGHVHESYGQLQTEDTLFINAVSIRNTIGIGNAPVVFEI